MSCVGRTNDRVRPAKDHYENDILIQFAKEKNIPVPETHYYMSTTVEFLRNDSIKMHDNRIFEPDAYRWQLVVDCYRRKYESLWANCEPITLAQAISLAEKDSSPGYLFKKLFRVSKKREVFEKHLDYLRESILAISHGEQVPMVWEHGPKNEIRPVDKFTNPDLSKRKQRTFMVSDTLHYVVGIMLYHQQNELLLKGWDDPHDWSAAGMTLFHGGADTMARILLNGKSPTEPLFRCKDVSAMESSVNIEIQKIIYSCRNRTYKCRTYHVLDEFAPLNYAKLAEWWFNCTAYGPLIDIDGYVWARCGQNPSGQLNTLNDNIHALELTFMYTLSHNQMNADSLQELCHTVIVKMMGDDSIYPDRAELQSLDDDGHDIGFTITDELEGLVSLFKAKFCGFGWAIHVNHPFYFIFRADTDKVMSSIFRHRKNNSWRFTLAKLFAAKVLLYGTQHYEYVCMMIAFIKTHYYREILAEKRFDDVLPVDALFKQEKSEREIGALILGYETLVGAPAKVPL